MLSKPSVSELTVEDPAEAFEDLRDRNDLAMLLGHTAFISEGFGDAAVSHGGGRVGRTARTAAKGKGRRKETGGKLSPPADRAWLERWRKDLKIAGVSIFFCFCFCFCLILAFPAQYRNLTNVSWLLNEQIASVPPACGNAYPVAPEPCRYASRQSLQVASEGAIIPFQLCESQIILFLLCCAWFFLCARLVRRENGAD